jgi:hypothetical protein
MLAKYKSTNLTLVWLYRFEGTFEHENLVHQTRQQALTITVGGEKESAIKRLRRMLTDEIMQPTLRRSGKRQ